MATTRDSREARTAYFTLANESVVVATMIHDMRVRRELAQRLTDEDFGDERNKVIFSALVRMDRAKLEWSEDTLHSLVGSESEFGGWKYLREIVKAYEPNANIDYHVERMKLDAAAFAVASALPDVRELCADPKRRDAAAIDRALRALGDRVSRLSSGFEITGTAADRAWTDEMRLRATVGPIAERTFFPLMDRLIRRGFRPGISILAGRPGHGKSSWLANVLRQRANAGKRSFVGAWEMSQIDYVEMMVAAELGIPHDDLEERAGDFSDDEKHRIYEQVRRFNRHIVYERNPFPNLAPVDKPWDKFERNMRHLESTIRRASQRCAFLALDVFSQSLSDTRPETFKEALMRTRNVAVECGVHVMLVHHLNREGAQGRPTLEHLKGSGALEEQADIVLAAEQPRLRAGPSAARRMSDVIDLWVLKQKKGRFPLCARYDFDGARCRLTNERVHDERALEQQSDGDEEDAA
jgi:replicative DNA helicase